MFVVQEYAIQYSPYLKKGVVVVKISFLLVSFCFHLSLFPLLSNLLVASGFSFLLHPQWRCFEVDLMILQWQRVHTHTHAQIYVIS